MANASRQLKVAFDESRNYHDADRFYAKEMLYTLKSQYFLNPLLLLHLVSSYFGTSWILATIFLFFIGTIKLIVTENFITMSLVDIITKIINNINPYLNLKETSNPMNFWQFTYVILLSYGLYQFVLSVRRISKR